MRKSMNDDLREKVMYLLFGILTTVVSLLSYRVLTAAMALHYLTATGISWIIAVVFAFVTNKLFVFRSQAKDSRSLLREGASFLLFRVASLFLDLGIMYVMVDHLDLHDMVAKVFATAVIVVANYFASKFIIFRNRLD